MSTAPVEPRALAVVPETSGELSVEQMIQQTQKIQRCMQAVMKRDEHYGVIPGTGTKPTLLKPGAEKLCLMFRLDPEYEVMSTVETGDRISYMIRCVLYHIPTGARVASGLGSCNSREEKYMRAAPKKCPNCSKETIIKGKEEYGGGWLCFAKKGGCSAKFKDGDAAITEQDTGIKDPSDLANTLLKMACKRALVAAVLNGTAASDFFTQDLEDLTTKAAAYTDVEVTPVDPKGEPAAATQSRNAVETASTTAARTAGPTSAAKPTRKPVAGGALPANEMPAKPGDPPSVPGQWAQIHMLREKIPGWGGDHSDHRHLYNQQLMRYQRAETGPDGKPLRCASAKELSFDQAKNFIQRMMGLIERKEVRAANEPDIGAVIPEAPQVKISASNTSTIHGYLHKQGMTELELCSIFGVDAVAELSDDQSANALALVMAYGTSNYERVLAKVQHGAENQVPR